jgi:signal transduction histidine kinase
VDEVGHTGTRAAEAQAALERQSRVRHDLRAPLAVLTPQLELMLESGDPLTPRQREQLAVLQRQTQRMEAMITSVTESGWFDCCAAPTEVVAVPLQELVAEFAGAPPQWGADDGAPPEIVAEPGTPPALADAGQVRQVLGDLLANVRGFAGGPATIRLGPGSAPGTVALAVADRGPGIAEHELPHVTEFGFRGAGAAERAPGGLGLGLWVCRRLVEGMGGALQVESAAGAGTRVTVLLPAAW